MSSVPAVVRSVIIERGNDDVHASAIGNLRRATIGLDSGGTTAVAGGTDTLDLNLATAIQNSVRDGKTVTIRTASISQALQTETAAGVKVTHAGFLSMSSNTASITPKSDGYLTGSSNSTIAAATPIGIPYAITVAYTVA